MSVRAIATGVLVWAAQTVAAALVAGIVTVAVAAATTSPWVFLTAGTACGTAAWAAVSLARRRRRRARDERMTLTRAVPDLVTALTLVLLLVATLVPMGDPVVPPATPPNAGTWSLADGTHIAYGMVPSAPTQDGARPPVVILHGGPGVPDLAGELAVLGPLAAQGRDVYAYAQVGAGRSSRLPDPSGYTVDRAVRDLEAIRQRIGAGRMVLIGHSYGAYLASAYAVRHPTRVATLVLSSPGDLVDGLSGTAVQQRLSLGQKLRTYRLLASPRALLAYALTQVRPASAHAFAGDAEMDARNDRVYRATEQALHCAGDRLPSIHGTGFYALQVPQSLAAAPSPDLRGALPDVRALVIKGQCDYLPWDDATDYLQALPDAEVAYIRGAGHDAYRDEPAAYLADVAAFLRGRRPPDALADPRDPPAGYQHDG